MIGEHLDTAALRDIIITGGVPAGLPTLTSLLG
jgi:hypothetical protein